MKRLLKGVLVSGLLAAVAPAHAVPISFTDYYDPVAGAGNLRFSSNSSDGPDRVDTLTFVHDINDGAVPYDALTDTITSVSIELRFVDDNDTPAESVTFTLDGVGFGTVTLASGAATDAWVFSSPALALSTLVDGLLTVKLDLAGLTSGHPSGRSDFYFIDSTLTVNAERRALEAPAAGSVPAPGTLLLLGVGLAAMGSTIRLRAKS